VSCGGEKINKDGDASNTVGDNTNPVSPDPYIYIYSLNQIPKFNAIQSFEALVLGIKFVNGSSLFTYYAYVYFPLLFFYFFFFFFFFSFFFFSS